MHAIFCPSVDFFYSSFDKNKTHELLSIILNTGEMCLHNAHTADFDSFVLFLSPDERYANANRSLFRLVECG